MSRLRGFPRSRLRNLNAGHLVQRADDNVVRFRIANDEVRPKKEGTIGVTDLVNIAIGHSHFKRLKGPTSHHLTKYLSIHNDIIPRSGQK